MMSLQWDNAGTMCMYGVEGPRHPHEHLCTSGECLGHPLIAQLVASICMSSTAISITVTPARYSDMHCSNSSQTLLQRFDDAVIT